MGTPLRGPICAALSAPCAWGPVGGSPSAHQAPEARGEKNIARGGAAERRRGEVVTAETLAAPPHPPRLRSAPSPAELEREGAPGTGPTFIGGYGAAAR